MCTPFLGSLIVPIIMNGYVQLRNKLKGKGAEINLDIQISESLHIFFSTKIYVLGFLTKELSQ